MGHARQLVKIGLERSLGHLYIAHLPQVDLPYLPNKMAHLAIVSRTEKCLPGIKGCWGQCHSHHKERGHTMTGSSDLAVKPSGRVIRATFPTAATTEGSSKTMGTQ